MGCKYLNISTKSAHWEEEEGKTPWIMNYHNSKNSLKGACIGGELNHERRVYKFSPWYAWNQFETLLKIWHCQ